MNDPELFPCLLRTPAFLGVGLHTLAPGSEAKALRLLSPTLRGVKTLLADTRWINNQYL